MLVVMPLRIARRWAELAMGAILVAGCGQGPPSASDAAASDDGRDASTAGNDGASFGGGARPARVILIDWDGFDPSYLDLADLPNLDRLIDRGSLSIARGTYKTISNPSRASIVTGAYPEAHRNVAYVYDEDSDRVIAQSRFLAAETLTQALARQGKTTASVQWYMVQNHGNTFGDPEHLYVQPGGDCVERINVAIDILHRRPVESGGELVTVPRVPDFMAVYCSEIDGLGHQEGPNSPNMIPLIEETDYQLGRLIDATEALGLFDDTAFLFVTDHGMTAYSEDIQPRLLQVIRDLGFSPERPGGGSTPAPQTDVILTAIPRSANVFLRGEAATEEARAEILAAIAAMPEIERIVEPDELRSLRAAVELEGEFVIEPKEPYGFAITDLPAGSERGGHSALSEISGPLVLSGRGVCRQTAPDGPELVDIAPTVAALLGVAPPADAQGRALDEALCLD